MSILLSLVLASNLQSLEPPKQEICQPKTPKAHVGSIVIFVQYIAPYKGQKWAALMIEDPRECPPNSPEWWKDCANLKIWKRELSQSENPTVVLGPDEQPRNCEIIDGQSKCDHVYTGDDNKIGVPHDPTGTEGRSWHIWGEAPDEQDPQVTPQN